MIAPLHLARPSGPGNGPGQPRGAAGRCRIPGCTAVVSPQRLMCRPHWYRVPKQLRDLIWASWRSGTGARSSAYRQAVRRAAAAAQAAAGGQAVAVRQATAVSAVAAGEPWER